MIAPPEIKTPAQYFARHGRHISLASRGDFEVAPPIRVTVRELFEEEQLDFSVVGKCARRNHSRVVQHHEVAAFQKCREVRKHPVLDALFGAVKDHHARTVAALGGMARDEALGQRVIVVGGAETHRAAKVPLRARGVHFRMQCGMNREEAKKGCDW